MPVRAREEPWAAPPPPVPGAPDGTIAADEVALGVAPAALPPLPLNPVGDPAPTGPGEVGDAPAEPGVPVGVAAVVEAVVADGAVVVVVVVGGEDVRQVDGVVMVLAWRVTAPFLASTRPWTVAPVSSDAEVSAMRVPTKVDDEFNVAELPTTQKTWQACAPLIS